MATKETSTSSTRAKAAKPAAKKPAAPKQPAAKKPAAKAAARKPAAKAKSAAKPVAKKPAPKKAAAPKASPAGAARQVAKVSPLRGMSLDAWITEKTSGWQSDVVRRIASVVAKAAPEATCEIKWSQPVWDFIGPFAFVKPAKAHLSVGFWRGSEIVDPKGLLERGDRMGHFKLRGPDELDEQALAAMVKDAVRLNREKGTPTRRG